MAALAGCAQSGSERTSCLLCGTAQGGEERRPDGVGGPSEFFSGGAAATGGELLRGKARRIPSLGRRRGVSEPEVPLQYSFPLSLPSDQINGPDQRRGWVSLGAGTVQGRGEGERRDGYRAGESSRGTRGRRMICTGGAGPSSAVRTRTRSATAAVMTACCGRCVCRSRGDGRRRRSWPPRARATEVSRPHLTRPAQAATGEGWAIQWRRQPFFFLPGRSNICRTRSNPPPKLLPGHPYKS